MNELTYDYWTDKCHATFDQWIHAHFVPSGRREYTARVQRHPQAWIALLAGTPFMFSQHNQDKEFIISNDEFNVNEGEQDCLFVFARFTSPDGTETFEPTEGMLINTTTGEMSYV